MSERKDGWYWVLLEYSGWVVARYEQGRMRYGEGDSKESAPWVFSGMSFPDDQWEEIGPRIPTPDEPWQCVPLETTSNMDDAGCEAGASAYADYEGIRIVDAWEAMLAAAPKP